MTRFIDRNINHSIDYRRDYDENRAFGLDDGQRPRVYSRSAGRACQSMPIILR